MNPLQNHLGLPCQCEDAGLTDEVWLEFDPLEDADSDDDILHVTHLRMSKNATLRIIRVPGESMFAAALRSSNIGIKSMESDSILVKVDYLTDAPVEATFEPELLATKGAAYFKGNHGFLCKKRKAFARYNITVSQYKKICSDSFSWFCDHSCVWRSATVKLRVARHRSAVLSNEEADAILESARNVLKNRESPADKNCNANLLRRGNVDRFETGNGVINSARQLNQIFDLAGNIKVVNQLNFCSRRANSVIGCARTPGKSMIVERFNPALEGILWAHEYAHMRGAPHREGARYLMNPYLTAQGTEVNEKERRIILTGGPITLGALLNGPIPAAKSELPLVRIEDFVKRHYVHGIPWGELEKYAADLDEDSINPLFDILNDPLLEEFHANTVIAVAFLAFDGVGSQLISYLEQATGQLTPAADKARQMLIAHLGTLYGNTGEPEVLEYLISGATSAEFWKERIAWESPFHANWDEQARQLMEMSGWGLAYSGSIKAAETLADLAAATDPNPLYAEAMESLLVVQNYGLTAL